MAFSFFQSNKQQKTKETLQPPKKWGGWGAWLAVIVGFLACFFILKSFLFEWEKKQAIDREVSALQGEIERLRKEKTDMQEALRYLNTSEFQEKELKDKLNLVKEGEQVIYVKESEVKKEEKKEFSVKKEDLGETEVSVKKPNYYYWWKYLFQM